MTTPVLADILLGQWQQSPRLRGVVVPTCCNPSLPMRWRLPTKSSGCKTLTKRSAFGLIISACGWALNGRQRPIPHWTRGSGSTLRARVSISIRSVETLPTTQCIPLPDAIYRRFVKARAVTVLSDGTAATYVKAVRLIDPTATVVDNRDMTVTVTTALQDLLELADGIGALPRTAGVMVIYA